MRAALLVVVGLLVAGCVQPDPEAESVTLANATPSEGLALELLPTGAPPATEAAPSLDAPPQWRGGEWWKVKVTDAFDGKSWEATRVVAGKEGEAYLVGMPRDAFSNEQMVIHLPGYGQVSPSSLGFEVHNCPFDPLQFPLTEGKEWDTQFECRDFHAKATVKSPTIAQVELSNKGGERMVVTYDAQMHEVSKIVFDGYATVEVTDHGYDFQGIVTVPHMFHLVFQQVWSSAGVLGAKAPEPVQTVKVDSTYDRVSFVLIVGSLVPFVQPGAPDAAAGYYDEKVTGPDGKPYELVMLPHESGLKLAYFMVDKPGGEWQFQHVVAGPGLAVAEGIAYHVYDVEMPSGRILPSHGEHQHGS